MNVPANADDTEISEAWARYQRDWDLNGADFKNIPERAGSYFVFKVGFGLVVVSAFADGLDYLLSLQAQGKAEAFRAATGLDLKRTLRSAEKEHAKVLRPWMPRV
ncbi:hypothetical protein N7523_005602 [Penicillium sp. IBT 18751x]|nr:hypothetical protein N7523_005806 [Penicillium sp. IBT 18751x]KAJ6117851.1 hypothetical protein N7523_005602 [Penicillium sp. IBT 18751x]